jgi:hypothetical protein
MDPIKYLFASSTLVGTFVFPGQVDTNPGGPYKASGVLSLSYDWITALGFNWTITINTPTPLIFFPQQFNRSGGAVSVWVPFNASITDWSSYAITAVRNGSALALNEGTSGVGGTLDTVDLTSADYAFLPTALQGGLQGIATKVSTWWHKFVLVVGIIILIVVAIKVYHLVRG